ncbi:TorF family putative porin [Thiohalophilus sp.]|uniref:TorF family putative porin n=1 Tax=Thiohalophilus sp. TaxID=3028392 RepID=UPI002ACEFF8C|nr:TorF family putative porin [Thiohalophilus sp.]MDZ7660778.1 TorF family putative porin [Thiohalophilus sp.]MDZ7661323.1 TorF family putative porin [Thiohalophilus sp.]
MKNVKVLLVGSALAASTVASPMVMAETSVSANVGYTSDYFFRGVYQAESSASAGLDVEFGPGFYAGTWLADVNDGVEYDLYAGYAGEYQGFSYDLGYVTYNYSDDWDDTYSEVAASLGYGPISVAYAVGEWDGFGTPADYTFLSVSAEYKGAYITFGSWGDEFEGDYTELGYSKTVSDVDYSVALINNDKNLDLRSSASDGSVGETALTFSIGYAWDL